MAEILGEKGIVKLLLGNEAVARGAIEAGIDVAAGYPGTPSTEIIEALIPAARELGFYVEWSTNEKVALEVALGAAISGLRGLAVMKHVGLNVAADTFMSIGYTGVRGGLVIVSADDPNCHSSQSEQDNRIYGMHAYIPVIEPYAPQEAKDATIYAFDLSEKYSTAIMLRLTTRISHTRGPVVFGDLRRRRTRGNFIKDPSRWVLLPVFSRKLHVKALERISSIAKEFSNFPLNKIVQMNPSDEGIIASGVAYGYVMDALNMLNLRDKVSVLKLATPYPIPNDLIISFLKRLKRVLIVEELEPVVELQVKDLVVREGISVEIKGKEYVPRVLELNYVKVAKAIAEFLGLQFIPPRVEEENLPPRPPVFCPGCPHRATYYIIKRAVASEKVNAVYLGDIGCYTLGVNPPFRATDTSYCMGSSIGLSMGIFRATDQFPIATIGDSTFFHAGIPALINSIYNRSGILVVVFDNLITAMTGFQPHPGTGVSALGQKARTIAIEDIAKAIGVNFVKVIDPYNINESVKIMREAIAFVLKNKEPAVVVSSRECALRAYRRILKSGKSIKRYFIDENVCTKCLTCINTFACPAIMIKDNKVVINSDLCIGCGVCKQVCPYNAIKEVV